MTTPDNTTPPTFVTYPYIRALGVWLGSLPNYVNWQIELALAGNAPYNAVYRSEDGTWATLAGFDLDIREHLVNIAIDRGYLPAPDGHNDALYPRSAYEWSKARGLVPAGLPYRAWVIREDREPCGT